MDEDALKWIPDLADATSTMARWRLRVLEFGFGVDHGAFINTQVPDALLGLKTSGIDTTGLDEDFQEMMASIIEHRGEEINDDHDGNYDILGIFNSLMTLLNGKQRTTRSCCQWQLIPVVQCLLF